MNDRPNSRARRGIALVAALALMTLIAVVVVGAAASSTLAQRSARLGQADALLNGAADYAINTILAEPMRYGLASLPFGERQSFDVAIAGSSGAQAQVSVVRLPNGVLWISADAAMNDRDAGRRRVNVVARFPSLGPEPAAGLIVRGNVQLGAHVAFLSDSVGDAGCASAATSDIIVAPGSDAAGADALRVAYQAQAADSQSYFLSSSQLSTLSLAPGVLRSFGDTTIAGGSFTGILIVDGTITLSGPFSFTGLLVARGGIDARAGGLDLTGAMMAFGSGPRAVQLDGASIRYSLCAVQRALRSALPPRTVRQRGWTELF